MKPKTVKIIVFVLILIFYGLFLFNKVNLPAGDDMARHIKNGQLILLGQFKVIYSNFYSYTEPNHQFVNHNWLAAVIFYLLHQAVGWSGLIIFKAIILLTAFILLFFTAVKKSNYWLVVLLSIPTIFILIERTSLRPEMFSYLFTAVFLYLLIDSQTNPQQNRIYWLIPLQLLWVNIHLFFIIGLGLTAGFLFEKIIIDRQQNQLLIKKLFLLLTGLVPVCFINPNGINGALYPFRIFSNYGMNVIENQSIHEYLIANPLKDNLGIIFFLLSIITLGVSFILNLKRKPIFYFLGSLATAIAGFLIIRTLAFFGYIFLISAPVNLNSVFSRYVISLRKNPGLYKNVHRNFIRILIVLLFFLILSVFLGKIPGFNKPALGLADWSQDPAKFFVEQKLKGPIFNDYDTGSYLIYYLFPGEKVFVDNRPEAYSQSFFKNTYLPIFVDENAWQKALKKYQFNVIILNQYSNGVGVTDFKYRRFNDPDWALVFANPQAAIFLRNTEENKKIIDKFRLTPDNIEQRIGYLIKSKNYEDQVDAADILNLVGRPDLGNKQFFRLVTRYPDKSRVWLALGQWEFNRSNKLNSLLAIMYLEKAIATGQTTADAYTYLGAAYIEVSEFDKARLMLKKALQIDSSHLDAKNLLEKIRAK